MFVKGMDKVLQYLINKPNSSGCVGMLLEMDSAALQQLLGDHSMLAKAVQKAQAALDS